MNKVLIIEPFYGGSHKQLIDLLRQQISEYMGEESVSVVWMRAKKWHWRARAAAAYLREAIPAIDSHYKVLFASSVLNLAELVALRPDVMPLRKVLYFHENQLIYPMREQKERDFQYGYNQIISCLVADIVVFNSHFNMNSFLSNINSFIKLMPDYRPTNLAQSFAHKCRVIYYPIVFPIVPKSDDLRNAFDCLHILWPHRWEHDKGPQEFFAVLYQLKEENVSFKLSVIGETYSEIPDIFQSAKDRLKSEIVKWGFVEDREQYWLALRSCHVVVSTAVHEFFGVSMIEAAYSGCYPLCPNRLVYSELYPQENLYNSSEELKEKLKHWIINRETIPKVEMNFDKFNWNSLKPEYLSLINIIDS